MAIPTRSKTSSWPSKLCALTFDSMGSASNSTLFRVPPFASYSIAPIAWLGVSPVAKAAPNTTLELLWPTLATNDVTDYGVKKAAQLLFHEKFASAVNNWEFPAFQPLGARLYADRP
jgi:hypothetical protein